ncbi:MAG: 2-amino-4-hydroxy-6-hydroxymethyldihydropteridine diphosphokinase [Ginsengibacter sp.]
MNTVFLITGGNIGNRKENLQTAAISIEEEIGEIIRSSKIYETEAWGLTSQSSFYNQVHIIKSELSADKILDTILKIEAKMGRVRTIKNAARIIDIDILFFNDAIINKPNLIIPHPEINNRRFVLMPLEEVAPEMIHPVSKKNIKELLPLCKDTLKVMPLNS